MHMNYWDQASYPKFAAYIRDSFPKLIDVQNIVRGMQSWGHMSMDEIRLALEWQGGTTYTSLSIDIREPYSHEPWAKPGENEILRPTNVVSEVLVSPKAVRDFESGRGVSITAYGRKVYSVGAQLLGQIVYNYAIENYPNPRTLTTSEQRQAYAEIRRRGFFGQVYGGTPR
jgi:hypothetical protein